MYAKCPIARYMDSTAALRLFATGSRCHSVILGGSIMALGLFMMALAPLFYAALVTIVIGYGFFLRTLPSQIASLYAAQDPRKRSLYNLWYVGVNLGALFAPFACGTIGEIYGWN